MFGDMHFLEPNAKPTRHSMFPGKFLGTVQNHGDSLCCFMRTSSTIKSKRPQTLVRSVVQKSSEVESITSPSSDSDKMKLDVDKGVPPASIFKENKKPRSPVDSDDALVGTATTVASSYFESDLGDLESNIFSNDSIEEEKNL